ncbi:MAG: hypothetical protein L6R35_003658 [Caloplaca aegaea]|nr:MAG: hypothetical protein L6R35_003658 [Caloplaca aegaea]
MEGERPPLLAQLWFGSFFHDTDIAYKYGDDNDLDDASFDSAKYGTTQRSLKSRNIHLTALDGCIGTGSRDPTAILAPV